MFEGTLGSSQKLAIARQMRVCLSSGMSPASMLKTISSDPGMSKVSKGLLAASESVFEGVLLSKALKKAAGPELGLFFISFVAFAETTGCYDSILSALETIYQDFFVLSETIKGQLFLPKLSLFFLFLSLLVTNPNDLILYFFIIAGPVVTWFLVPSKARNKISAEFMLRVPFVSRALKKFYSALFIEVISHVIASGTTFSTARPIVLELFDFSFMREDIKRVFASLEKGNSLCDSFAPVSFLDSNAKTVFYIGQESGSTDMALKKTSELAMKDLKTKIETSLNLSSRFFLTLSSALIGLACYNAIGLIGKNLDKLM